MLVFILQGLMSMLILGGLEVHVHLKLILLAISMTSLFENGQLG